MDITTSPPASATAERITFQITTLPPEALDRIRAQGYDDHGNRLRPTIDTEGGAPLRCCLRDSRPGERIMLLAWSPFHQASPYAEVGPVFIHTEPCGGYADQDAYPDGFRARRQVFRPPIWLSCLRTMICLPPSSTSTQRSPHASPRRSPRKATNLIGARKLPAGAPGGDQQRDDLADLVRIGRVSKAQQAGNVIQVGLGVALAVEAPAFQPSALAARAGGQLKPVVPASVGGAPRSPCPAQARARRAERLAGVGIPAAAALERRPPLSSGIVLPG